MATSKITKTQARDLLFELFPEEKENYERKQSDNLFEKVVPYIVKLLNSVGEQLEPMFEQLFGKTQELGDGLEAAVGDIHDLGDSLDALTKRVTTAEQNLEDTKIYDEKIRSLEERASGNLEKESAAIKTELRVDIKEAKEAIRDAKKSLAELESFVKKVKKRFGTDMDGESDLEQKLTQLVLGHVETLRTQVYSSIEGIGRGGAQRIQILNDGSHMSDKFVDLNLIAGTGITISPADNLTTGRVDVTISTSGGAFTKLAATEKPNGSQSTFTFSTASAKPSYIVSDGVWYEPTLEDGTTAWTWNSGTNVATLAIPAPNKSIFAVV